MVIIAYQGAAEVSISAMQVFQSRLTEQVDSIAGKVAQLSAAQSLSPSPANAAGVFDQMPKAVEEAVVRSAENPQEPIQVPENGKETAYERMQVSCLTLKQALMTSISAVRKMTGLALHARTAQQYFLVLKGDLLTAYMYSITKGEEVGHRNICVILPGLIMSKDFSVHCFVCSQILHGCMYFVVTIAQPCYKLVCR